MILRCPWMLNMTITLTFEAMKTPERSCTSRVGYFLVLLPHTSLFDVIWRHDVILSHHMQSHHRPCHSDGTRHLSIVLNYYIMKFYLVTLAFDLRPCPTIPALLRSWSTPVPKIKVIAQMVWPWECSHTERKTAPIRWPRPLAQEVKTRLESALY